MTDYQAAPIWLGGNWAIAPQKILCTVPQCEMSAFRTCHKGKKRERGVLTNQEGSTIMQLKSHFLKRCIAQICGCSLELFDPPRPSQKPLKEGARTRSQTQTFCCLWQSSIPYHATYCTKSDWNLIGWCFFNCDRNTTFLCVWKEQANLKMQLQLPDTQLSPKHNISWNLIPEGKWLILPPGRTGPMKNT